MSACPLLQILFFNRIGVASCRRSANCHCAHSVFPSKCHVVQWVLISDTGKERTYFLAGFVGPLFSGVHFWRNGNFGKLFVYSLKFEEISYEKGGFFPKGLGNFVLHFVFFLFMTWFVALERKFLFLELTTYAIPVDSGKKTGQIHAGVRRRTIELFQVYAYEMTLCVRIFSLVHYVVMLLIPAFHRQEPSLWILDLLRNSKGRGNLL